MKLKKKRNVRDQWRHAEIWSDGRTCLEDHGEDHEHLEHDTEKRFYFVTYNKDETSVGVITEGDSPLQLLVETKAHGDPLLVVALLLCFTEIEWEV